MQLRSSPFGEWVLVYYDNKIKFELADKSMLGYSRKAILNTLELKNDGNWFISVKFIVEFHSTVVLVSPLTVILKLVPDTLATGLQSVTTPLVLIVSFSL